MEEMVSMMWLWSPVPKAANSQGSKEFKAAIGFRDMEVIDEQIPLLVE